MSTTDEGDEVRTGRLQRGAAGGGLDQMLDCFQQAALAHISGVFRHIDREALERAVVALAEARCVLVAGTYPAHSFATHLHHVAAMRFGNWRLVEWHSAEPSRAWSALAAQDVVIGIATEPYENNDFELAHFARSVGARVVGITDGPDSPLADCADDILLFAARSASARHSHVGMTALIEALVGMVAARRDGLDAAGQA